MVAETNVDDRKRRRLTALSRATWPVRRSAGVHIDPPATDPRGRAWEVFQAAKPTVLARGETSRARIKDVIPPERADAVGENDRGFAGRTVRLLDHDAELAQTLTGSERAQARRACVALEVSLEPGPWLLGQSAQQAESGYGLLVLGGLLSRRIGHNGRFGAELLGAGDLLRPLQDSDHPSLPVSTQWSVLLPARLAVLDMDFAKRAASFPGLAVGLTARVLARSRNLALNMLIVHNPRTDARLHMLFWYLAERWGRVRPDGIILRLPLTHTQLAELVAASRPTVSAALATLTDDGVLKREGRFWILRGEPPGELRQIDSASAA